MYLPFHLDIRLNNSCIIYRVKKSPNKGGS
jgi:hypothetical protein